jgi:hypothetical protein
MWTLPTGAWLALSWLAVGSLTATWLRSEGHAPGTCLAALLAWPFFLPLAARAVPTPTPHLRTPHSERIDRALHAVAVTLAEHGETEQTDEVAALRDALHAADRRIAWVDQILAEHQRLAGDLDSAPTQALRAARDRAAAELDQVVREVLQLRLDLGLHALRGDAAPIGRTLAGLRARVATLEELASLGPSSHPAPRTDRTANEQALEA